MEWTELIASTLALMIPILAILGGLATAILVTWMRIRQRRAELETRTQIYNRLIEKYGSASELTEFLKTQEGRAFLQGLAMRPAERPTTVLRWIRTGLILTFLGLAFMLAVWWSILDEERGAAFVGIILIALGIAFFLGAWVTYWLGRRLKEPNGRSPEKEA
ncbi:MAG: DUF202 domain-containing protein [Acidobacteria bacterium]|nr:DUF202 domain-containing protein [Acidobacteriota bacterium]MDW7985049.1 DUF202 domain-containing protein [Acidobacteriota bacterium]